MLGRTQQPLAGVSVNVHYPATYESIAVGSDETDSEGRYSLSLTRLGPNATDTVTITVLGIKGADDPPADTGEVVDSTAVRIRFAPLDEPAPVTTAELTLPVP